MNKVIMMILLPYLLTGTSLFSETLPEGEIEFLPHMATHVYEGCPSNSVCTESMGKKRQQFLSTIERARSQKATNAILLLDDYVKNEGHPIEVWISKHPESSDAIIWWDSPCIEHNEEGKEKYVGLLLTPNLTKNKNPKIFLESLYSIDEHEKIHQNYVPRGIFPSYFDGEDIVLTEFNKELYYGLKIKRSGTFSAVHLAKDYQSPISTSCPKKLLEYFEKTESGNPFYLKHTCRKIWDIKSQKYIPSIVGRTCL